MQTNLGKQRKKRAVFPLTILKKNWDRIFFGIFYLDFTGQESDINSACPKMTMKTLGFSMVIGNRGFFPCLIFIHMTNTAYKSVKR